MREFVLYSRKGRTDAHFTELTEAGRLDVVCECIVASLFLSHGIRRNVTFNALLSGPPSPPLHLEIDGASLKDVRTDQGTWERILKKVLSGGSHPGMSVSKNSFETLLKSRAGEKPIYVMEEGGRDIFETDLRKNPVFVLGDHIGLPKAAEVFALRFGEKISLGKQPYLAASCISVLNYLMDRRAMV